MEISRARKLRYGDRVIGTPGSPGHEKGGNLTVRQSLAASEEAAIYLTPTDIPYIWVVTNSGIWPSNRLT